MSEVETTKEPYNIYLARKILKSGIENPYSGVESDDIFHQAANGILYELADRDGIDNELDKYDDTIRKEITDSIADIIHVAITDHIANKFFKDDESGNVKILSITDAKRQLEELFARNMIKAATD